MNSLRGFGKPALVAPLLVFVAVAPALAQPAQDKPAAAPAAQSNKQLETVVIEGARQTDTDARRYSTAGKMVFGREELDRAGNSTLGDVLKRLPGVTLSGAPGRGGDIRMRGLGGGYTLILINGEPAPRGFSIDDLAPEQVERIEVMRAPVAEHSARAIAGTINIVLREPLPRTTSEARPAIAFENGQWQPSLYLQRADRLGGMGYNLNLNLFHRDSADSSRLITQAVDPVSGATTLAQDETDNSLTRSKGVYLGGNLNWKLAGGESLSLQPFLFSSRSASRGEAELSQSVGTAPPPLTSAEWHTDSSRTIARTMAQWRRSLESGAKLELRGNAGLADRDSQGRRFDADVPGAPAGAIRTTLNDTAIRDRSLSLSGKFSRPLGEGHQLAVGGEVEGGRRTESASTVQDGVDLLAGYGGDLSASTRRVALYAQDEWDIQPLWSVYGGLRWETIATATTAAGQGVDNRSGVVSPLAHSVWRFDADSKDQIRLSLARTYRSPTLNNLVPRPSISTLYPVSGANTPVSPDRAGNPELLPELSWGLDLAFEHYLPAGGVLSANLFERRIDQLIRTVTQLESVPWSPVPRWVARPRNLGKAQSRGIELEAKWRLADLWASAPAVELRANFSRFWSSVDEVPGPDNRIEQQPRATGNIGFDYRPAGLPLMLGGSLNWTPAFTVQQTATQTYSQGIKRVVDAYALWTIDSRTKLRLSASNLAHADYTTAQAYVLAGSEQSVTTIANSFITWAARLEMKF